MMMMNSVIEAEFHSIKIFLLPLRCQTHSLAYSFSSSSLARTAKINYRDFIEKFSPHLLAGSRVNLNISGKSVIKRHWLDEN
jgi:hypothetical protein